MIDLEELYAIDPSLRAHEGELKKLLTTLESSKPNMKIDQEFVTELRRDLLSREPKQSFVEKILKSMNKIPFYIGGAVTLGLVALIGYNIYNEKGPVADTSVAVRDSRITGLAPGAFGSLRGTTPGTPTAPTSEAGSSLMIVEDGAIPTSDNASEFVRPQSGGGGLTAPSPMIYPAPPQYTFEYGGEDYVITDASLPVYRRNKAVHTASVLGNLIASQSNGVINLSGLGNMDLVNFQLHEKNGNNLININLREGRVFINPDYSDGRPEIAYDRQLTKDDVPDDAVLIKTATDFLKRYNIDASSYGEPIVDNTWRIYAEANAGRELYVPQIINVIFPIEVDGQIIYDQGGNKHGLNVQVNITTNSVMGVHNLMTMNFDKSSYEIETDFENIKEYALRGGINGYWYGSMEGGTVTLNTPEMIYLNYVHYNQEERQSVELFIPALKFGFIDQSKELGNVPRSIIVPLVKDILEMYGKNRPVVMPLIEPATGMPVPEPGSEAVLEMEVIESDDTQL